jgi:hypothetical protein
MKLSVINNFLKIFGLYLVISFDPKRKEPTKLWIERSSTFNNRCKAK